MTNAIDVKSGTTIATGPLVMKPRAEAIAAR